MLVVRIGKQKFKRPLIIPISFGESFEDICFTNLFHFNNGCVNFKENLKKSSPPFLIIEYCIVFLFKPRAIENVRNMSVLTRS